MKKNPVNIAVQKLMKTFLSKIGVEYQLVDNQIFSDVPDVYKLILYVDPSKYNWAGGPNYSKKYYDFMEDPEDYLNTFLKYIGLDSDIINDIEYRRTENSQSFYDEISEKLVDIWPNVVEQFKNKRQVDLPSIQNVTVEPQKNRPNDVMVLDFGNEDTDFFEDEHFFNYLFVYTADNDLPLDTFYVTL